MDFVCNADVVLVNAVCLLVRMQFQPFFDDVLPAIKSAKAARMLAGGIYDKYSADQRTEIERIADIYLL